MDITGQIARAYETDRSERSRRSPLEAGLQGLEVLDPGADSIRVCVPFTRGGDALWLDVTREQAERFADEAHEHGLRVHAQWDGAVLRVGGGSAIRPGATIPARGERRA
jgi:hypothetical protein